MANDDTVIAGRYRLELVLGRGGMAEVWRAKDLELGRLVALKLLAPDADRARFEREARAVASLAHPNITQVYDFGQWEGRPYMVLEYLPGGTLEDRLERGKPLPDDETRTVAAGVAAGLAHAHARGVVHRDLKPANVLFDDEGRPKVADFGIAQMAGGGTLTDAGTVLGTAAYISPEQAQGNPATSASDVYSFGVILYRMLTGRLPFAAENPLELVTLHRDATPPPVDTLRSDAPALLESTASAALAKDPRERPPDGAALLRMLGVPTGAAGLTTTAVLDGAATQVLPVAAAGAAGAAAAAAAGGVYPQTPRRRSRTPLVVAALVVLALAGAVVAYAVTRDSSPSPTGTVSAPSAPTTRPHTTTPATTAPTTTAHTTTAHTTTQQTTARQTTTQAPTTRPATTQPPTTTPPTTTAPPTTTTAPPTTTTEPPTTTAPPATTTATSPADTTTTT